LLPDELDEELEDVDPPDPSFESIGQHEEIIKQHERIPNKYFNILNLSFI
jgi:hypothetical protein